MAVSVGLWLMLLILLHAYQARADLRAELNNMTTGASYKKAVAMGVSAEDLETASDDDDLKGVLIEFVLEELSDSSSGYKELLPASTYKARKLSANYYKRHGCISELELLLRCSDDGHFLDMSSHRCTFWKGRHCAAGGWGVAGTGIDFLKARCPLSCGLCNTTTTSTRTASSFTSYSKSGRWAPSAAKRTCREASWPDIDHGLVCGTCKVLVNHFDSRYQTCDGYCNLLGLACQGAWEEYNDTCTVLFDMTCNETLASSDAICECTTLTTTTSTTTRNQTLYIGCYRSQEYVGGSSPAYAHIMLGQEGGLTTFNQCAETAAGRGHIFFGLQRPQSPAVRCRILAAVPSDRFLGADIKINDGFCGHGLRLGGVHDVAVYSLLHTIGLPTLTSQLNASIGKVSDAVLKRECMNDIDFRDGLGYACRDYRGMKCSQVGAGANSVALLLARCPKVCGVCIHNISSPEKRALMMVTHNLVNEQGGSYNLSSFHCEWTQVVCLNDGTYNIVVENSQLTPHISKLHGLRDLRIRGTLNRLLPSQLGRLTNLETIMWERSLSGTMPTQLGNMYSLLYLGFPSNKVIGSLPSELGKCAPGLKLDAQHNFLSGSIPSELGNAAPNSLQLQRNRLSGSVPANIISVGLMELLLHHNRLSGLIPCELGRNVVFKAMHFAHNKFTGPLVLPNGASDNAVLDFRSNDLTGKIPTQIGRLANLKVFSAASNKLSGPIPSEIGNTNLQYLLLLERNSLQGTLPITLGRLTKLQRLKVSHNDLKGKVRLGSFPVGLIELDVRGNSLSGTFPSTSSLTVLSDIDASDNIFTSIDNLSQALKHVSFSNNLLALDFFNVFCNKLPNLKNLNLANNRHFVSAFQYNYLSRKQWDLGRWFFTASGSCAESNVPRNECTLPSLLEFVVDNCPLGADIHDFLHSLGPFVSLVRVSAKGCKLHGGIRSQKGFFVPTFLCKGAVLRGGFENLAVLDLSYNSISAIAAPRPRVLSEVNLAYNPLVQLSSHWWNTPHTLDIRGCPALNAPVAPPRTCPHRKLGRLEFISNARAFHVPSSNAKYECTTICAKMPTTIKVNYTLNTSMLCRCISGYVGSQTACVKCPPNHYENLSTNPLYLVTQCTACPNFSSTTTGNASHTSIDDCQCKRGYFMDKYEKLCQPCGPGRFSAAAGGTSCTACVKGHTSQHGSSACMQCGLDEIVSADGSVCERCDAVSSPQYDRRTCSMDFTKMLRWAVFIAWVALFMKLLIVNTTRYFVITDIHVEYGRTILTTRAVHRLYCRSEGRGSSFPIAFQNTANKRLDVNSKVRRARVCDIDKLELLDEGGHSIIDMFDTSRGTLSLRWADVFLHVSWPCRKIPLPLPLAVVLLNILVFVYFNPVGATIVSLVVVVAAVVVGGTWRLWCHRYYVNTSPLNKRLKEFQDRIDPHARACTKGPGRAIKIGKLLDTQEFFQNFIRQRNAYYLDGNILRPLTAKYKLSFAEIMGPTDAMWFVSHFWGCAFTYFCKTIEKHARSQSPSAYSGPICASSTPTELWRDLSYWICFCSNNQYNLPDELGGSAGWMESSFYLTLNSNGCKGTCMVLDNAAKPLTRSWCIFETLQTLKISKQRGEGFAGLLLCTSTGVLNYGQGTVEAAMGLAKGIANMDLEQAQASRKSEKDMIDKLVLQEMGTYEALNSYVREDVRIALKKSKRHCDNDFAELFNILSAPTDSQAVAHSARVTLELMMTGALLKRAMEIGINPTDAEDAYNSDNFRETLIQLILSRQQQEFGRSEDHDATGNDPGCLTDLRLISTHTAGKLLKL